MLGLIIWIILILIICSFIMPWWFIPVCVVGALVGCFLKK